MNPRTVMLLCCSARLEKEDRARELVRKALDLREQAKIYCTAGCMELAMQCEDEAAESDKEAMRCFQQAVRVTHDMAQQVIKVISSQALSALSTLLL